MSQVMSATEVRMHFGEVMRQVASKGERVVVERGGKPMVAVISVADLARLQEIESERMRPANQAFLDWLDRYTKTVDAAETEWWLEFEHELAEDPVVLGREE
jgi:prevent-host-death family protein